MTSTATASAAPAKPARPAHAEEVIVVNTTALCVALGNTAPLGLRRVGSVATGDFMRLLHEDDLRWITGGGCDSYAPNHNGPCGQSDCTFVEEVVVTACRHDEDCPHTSPYPDASDEPPPPPPEEECPWPEEEEPAPPPPPPPPPPTLAERAAQYAEKTVKHGPGFDPANPQHQQQERLVKDALAKAYEKANDGVDGNTKLRDGTTLTDAQMRSVLDNLEVRLQTDNVRNNSAGEFNRWANADGVMTNYIKMDLDSPNVGNAESVFGTLAESTNLTLLHELGHAIDRAFGGSSTAPLGEDVANYYAVQMGQDFNMLMPTAAELAEANVNIYKPGP